MEQNIEAYNKQTEDEEPIGNNVFLRQPFSFKVVRGKRQNKPFKVNGGH